MYYFASDIHLGLKVGQTHATRERLFVRWLDEVSADAEADFSGGRCFRFLVRVSARRAERVHAAAGKTVGTDRPRVAVHFFPVTTTSGRSTTCRPSAGWYCTEPITKFSRWPGNGFSSDTAMCSASGGAGTAAEPGVSQPGDPVGFLDIRPSECGDAFRPLVERFEP